MRLTGMVTESPYSRWVRSKAFRIIIIVAILVLITALVIVVHVPLLREYPVYRFITMLLLVLANFAFYIAYGRRYYERHPKQSRVVFVVCFGLASSFMIIGIVGVLLGRPLPPLYSFLLFLALIPVGAYIGDKVGRLLKLY